MLKWIKKILFDQRFQKISIYGFGQLFNLVTPLLIVPYIVSICGEENLGKTAVGMAISFFLMVYVDYGSDIIGVREIAVNRDNHEKLNKIFTITYVVKTIILILVLFVVSFIFCYVPYFNKESKMFLLGLTVLIGQFLNPTWFLQGVENVKWITLLNIISKTIYLLGIYFTIKKPNDYIFVNLWWGIGMIVAHTFLFFLIKIKYKITFNGFSKQEVVSHIKNYFTIFSSQIFVSLQMYAPVFLISFFGNNLMAGQYKIVEQIILMFKTYILLFFNFLFPKVCYLININPIKGIKNWKTYNGFNFVFVIFSMFFIYLFSYDLVSYFNPTNRYVLSNLLQFAVFIPILLSISIPLKQLILAFNYKKYYINLTVIMGILNMLAIIVLFPKFQVYGVFYSLIGTDVLVIIFYLYRLKDNFKTK